MRNLRPLGPYSRTMPRVLRGSYGGGNFLMSKVPLQTLNPEPWRNFCREQLHKWFSTHPCRCRANMAHMRQSRPDSGVGFHARVLGKIKLLPLRQEPDRGREVAPGLAGLRPHTRICWSFLTHTNSRMHTHTHSLCLSRTHSLSHTHKHSHARTHSLSFTLENTQVSSTSGGREVAPAATKRKRVFTVDSDEDD